MLESLNKPNVKNIVLEEVVRLAENPFDSSKFLKAQEQIIDHINSAEAENEPTGHFLLAFPDTRSRIDIWGGLSLHQDWKLSWWSLRDKNDRSLKECNDMMEAGYAITLLGLEPWENETEAKEKVWNESVLPEFQGSESSDMRWFSQKYLEAKILFPEYVDQVQLRPDAYKEVTERIATSLRWVSDSTLSRERGIICAGMNILCPEIIEPHRELFLERMEMRFHKSLNELLTSDQSDEAGKKHLTENFMRDAFSLKCLMAKKLIVDGKDSHLVMAKEYKKDLATPLPPYPPLEKV